MEISDKAEGSLSRAAVRGSYGGVGPTLKRRIVICRERLPRVADDGTEIMSTGHFLKALWSGEIIDGT